MQNEDELLIDDIHKMKRRLFRRNVIIAFFVLVCVWFFFSPGPFLETRDFFYYLVFGGKMTVDKPVLYLYPEQETDVTVTLGSSDDITVSYPLYDKAWRVMARPDGTLIDDNNRSYNYLYWESDTDDFEPDFSEGFCVRGSDTAVFLEEQLSYMRLSDGEQDDFITYWLPRMQENPYNLISFQFGNYDEYEDLHISPEPDCLIKVFMAYKPLDEPVEIAPQALSGAERCGFTAVEWGGMECK